MPGKKIVEFLKHLNLVSLSIPVGVLSGERLFIFTAHYPAGIHRHYAAMVRC